MKFNESIMSHLVDLEGIGSEELSSTLSEIGLEVEGIEHFCAPGRVVVGKVLECENHPNATKLHVCKVAISKEGDGYKTLQIVCGAKNVKAGVFVAVALEGAKIGDLTIKTTNLRGVQSCGMLCSSTELGFPKINDGIIILDSSIFGGVLREYKEEGKDLEDCLGVELRDFRVFNDRVYEISVTPNRGDCLYYLGIAKEISVAFKRRMHPLPIIREQEDQLGIGRILQVNHTTQLTSSLAFGAVCVKDLAPPLSLSLTLAYSELLELESQNLLLNPQIALYNFVTLSTLLTGVLLYAYPQSLFESKHDKEDVLILTLANDKLDFECVFGKEKICILGVDDIPPPKSVQEEGNAREQGLGDGVCYILEASYIPSSEITNKTYTQNLRVATKTYYKASRGSNPNVVFGLEFLECLLYKAGAMIYNDMYKFDNRGEAVVIRGKLDYVFNTIGLKLEQTQIIDTLLALGFENIECDSDFLSLTPPPNRCDISNIQDVTEEIARIYRINQIPSKALFSEERCRIGDFSSGYIHYRNLRNLALRAISNGFSECVHFLFSHEEKLLKLGFEPLMKGKRLLNPITKELDTLRPTLLLGLIEACARNCNHSLESVSLFEIGSVYTKEREERHKIAFLQTQMIQNPRYLNPKGVSGDFFAFAQTLGRILGDFELEELEGEIEGKNLYHPTQSAVLKQGGKIIGILSTIHPLVALEYDIPTCFLCEVDLELLAKPNYVAKAVSKFQKITRDLSVMFYRGIPYQKIKEKIASLQIADLIAFYPIDKYEDSSLNDEYVLTVRFVLQSEVKTLEETEIQAVLDRILESLQSEFRAKLR